MSRANPRFRRANPALPAPSFNVFRVRVLGTVENQTTVSTFYYGDDRALATATAQMCNDLFTALGAAGNLLPKYAAAVSIDWLGTNVLIDVPTSPSLATQVFANATPGGGPSGHEPTYVSAVISRYTTVKGQAGRGRMYVPAVPATWVVASSITTMAAYNTLATQMLANVTAATHVYAPQIFSRGLRTQNPKVFGVSGVVQVIARPLLGTTRRRRVGRGK